MIINQLKLQPTLCNQCLYTGYYTGKKMVTERQRDGIEAPLCDMIEEPDSAQGELFGDSDNTESVVSGKRLVESISVPTFLAETIDGPQCHFISTEFVYLVGSSPSW